ncbi:MAG: stage II sporulation protein M [Armatimonadota bacterium]
MQGVSDARNSSAEDQRERWARLAALIERADRPGLKTLAPEELDEFARLYRRAAADLAAARSRTSDERVIRYLNNLVGRAHGLLYGGRARRRLNLRRFFLATIPRTFRDGWRFTAISAAVFLLPALITYLLAAANPAWADALFRPGMAEMVEEFLARDVPSGQWYADSQAVIGADALSGHIFVNNATIALAAFALGITAGLGTLYLLFSNGLMLGAFLGVFAHHDRLMDLFGMVAPHGVLEIFAIIVSGGAGLMIGWALIDPGERPRGQALAEAAGKAVPLIAGVVVMLAVGAAVEGFLSPQTTGLLQSNEPRVMLGVALWLAAMAWLLTGGRGRENAGRSEARPRRSQEPPALD